MWGHVGERGPAGHFRDSFICEDKYPRKAGVPVTGKEDSLRLPSQGSNGDLFYSLAVSGTYGGINSPQVHIRRHNKGQPWKRASQTGTSFGGG